MQGKIIKGIAGFYYIHVETSGIYECKAKGIFRNRHIKPLVGDNVEIEVIDKDNFKGNVVDILPRKNELIRPASANIDQAMVIFAVKTPEPNFNLLDKFILMMNYQDVPTVVCFNKEELADDEYKNELKKKYEDGDILMEGAKKFDAGLGVGVAYEINKFFIDLTGEFGLTKIYDGDGAPKNINFSIGVGYKF